jgi:DNA polymerase III delta subunit
LLQRAIANGDLNGVLAIMLSRLSRLSTVRAAVDSGLSWEGAFMRARPPIFFGQQQVVRDQVSRLSQDLLLRLQEQVQDAIYQGRRLGAAGDMAVGRSLLAMAVRMSPGAR